MTRIAVIGNSHVAAFKLGWDTIKDEYPGVQIDFFSGAASAMRSLYMADGRILSSSPPVTEMFMAYAGSEAITAGYDSYILVGMGLGLVSLMCIYEKHRPMRFYKPGEGPHLMSDAMNNIALEKATTGSSALHVLSLVKQISGDAEVFVVPNPHPSAIILEKRTFWNDSHIADYCAEIFEDTLRGLHGVSFVPQPVDTLHSDQLTKAEFTRGTRLLKARWTRPANEGDPFHMNAEFGVVSLRDIFTRLSIQPVDKEPEVKESESAGDDLPLCGFP